MYPLTLYGYMGLYPLALGVRLWTGHRSDKTQPCSTADKRGCFIFKVQSRLLLPLPLWMTLGVTCPLLLSLSLYISSSLPHSCLCVVYGSDLLCCVSHTPLRTISPRRTRQTARDHSKYNHLSLARSHINTPPLLISVLTRKRHVMPNVCFTQI